ncbi:hypothetical protein D3C80_1307910 [compost metagenome]
MALVDGYAPVLECLIGQLGPYLRLLFNPVNRVGAAYWHGRHPALKALNGLLDGGFTVKLDKVGTDKDPALQLLAQIRLDLGQGYFGRAAERLIPDCSAVNHQALVNGGQMVAGRGRADRFAICRRA